VPVLDPDGAAMAVLTCSFIRRVDGQEGLDADRITTSLLNTTRAMSVK